MGRVRISTVVAIGVVAIAIVVLVGLGRWQLSRQQTKNDLEAERTAALAAAPLDGEQAVTLTPPEIDYRRVRAIGRWDHERTAVIVNRFRSGVQGEDVVTPLLLAAGGPAILVNRGWYPISERDRVLEELAAEPAADVEGLARDDRGAQGRITSSGGWTRFAVVSMAAQLPYEVAPWQLIAGDLIDERTVPERGVLPVTGYLAYENTTPHTQYALTWFSLAIVLAVTAVLRLRRGSGGPDDRPPQPA